ncbi:MAG TPA: hypothetical protein VMG60_12350 [Burkholderiaceae bacterium]|nr:hypothetical protein [Burkholderiaceae bacterium]
MNHGETNTRDSGVLGAYRAASEILDEQPQPGTRAAILAAAARAVDAQPRDAATGVMSRRSAQRKRMAPGPSKRPLALVASFLAGTIVIVFATQTTRHQQATHEPAGAQVKVPEQQPAQVAMTNIEKDTDARRVATPEPARAAASTPEEAKVEAVPPQVAARRPEKQLAAPVAPAVPPAAEPPASTARIRQQGAADTLAVARERASRSEEAVVAAGAAAAPPAAVAAAPAPALAAPSAKESESTNQVALAHDERPARAADMSAQGRLAKAKPVERTVAIAEPNVENDPARWIERIIALRDAGHDEDADRELARLRERYPDVKVPPNALPRAGTR